MLDVSTICMLEVSKFPSFQISPGVQWQSGSGSSVSVCPLVTDWSWCWLCSGRW